MSNSTENAAITFQSLDPILHAQVRLAVMSLLMRMREAEFTLIRDKTRTTSGNLSVQLNKLKEAGYIHINKSFRNNYPQTICRISSKGVTAFEAYRDAIKLYLKTEISLP